MERLRVGIGCQHDRSVVQRPPCLYSVPPQRRAHACADMVWIDEEMVQFNRRRIERDEAVEPKITLVGCQDEDQEIWAELVGIKGQFRHSLRHELGIVPPVGFGSDRQPRKGCRLVKALFECS